MAASLGISMSMATGSVMVRSPALVRSAPWGGIKDFLLRLFSVPDVAAVKLDRRKGVAVLDFFQPKDWLTNPAVAAGLIRNIADGLRQPPQESELSDGYADLPSVRLLKLTSEVVGGSVFSTRAGRTRLVHPLLRRSPGLDAIVRPLLAGLDGIDGVHIGASSGTVLIAHAKNVSARELLVALERVIRRAYRANSGQGTNRRLYVSGANLGLATAAEFFVPMLIPVSAGALVLYDLRTLGRGLKELATFRWRLPALYTVIMGTTLVSGQVLAAAVMQASVAGWYWWSNRRIRHMVAKLLSSDELSQAVANVRRSERRASHGARKTMEALPREPGGQGVSDIVDESAPSNTVHSSLLTEPGCQAMIASLAQLASERQPTARSHIHASRFVPYTFVTGAAAALTSDIATLAAVLRPDFSTGPSITERLSTVACVKHLLDLGWLVLRPDVLVRLESVDTVVIVEESSPGSGSDAASMDSSDTRTEAVLTARGQTWELPTTRVALDVHQVCGSASACRRYVEQLAEHGRCVAVCGSARLVAGLNHEAVIRIVLDPDADEAGRDSDVVALPGHRGLSDLFDVLMHQSHCTESVWPVVLACNLVSVVGAFLAGLTSLHVVALTNFGTWTAYTYVSERFVRSPKFSARRPRLTGEKQNGTHDVWPADEAESVPRPARNAEQINRLEVATW